MEDKQILKAVADTFAGSKPLYEMVVPVRWLPMVPEPVFPKRTFLDRLLMRPIPPPAPAPETHRTLIFYPCVVANQYRIAGECALLPDAIFNDDSMNISLIPEHQKRIVYIVASAIQNNHLEPDPELMLFIERNLTGEQLRDALVASFQSLNMEAFTDTIVLMRPMVKILKPEETSQN
ncbi:MAG: hypothetical protein ABIN91_11260 [Mucilaginibacter sp.]|uniref:hypothetical protein n=1 Tax=Mucilaginibacter sp. TaxID=1882438 RepID=UPI003263D24A